MAVLKDLGFCFLIKKMLTKIVSKNGTNMKWFEVVSKTLSLIVLAFQRFCSFLKVHLVGYNIFTKPLLPNFFGVLLLNFVCDFGWIPVASGPSFERSHHYLALLPLGPLFSHAVRSDHLSLFCSQSLPSFVFKWWTQERVGSSLRMTAVSIWREMRIMFLKQYVFWVCPFQSGTQQ